MIDETQIQALMLEATDDELDVVFNAVSYELTRRALADDDCTADELELAELEGRLEYVNWEEEK